MTAASDERFGETRRQARRRIEFAECYEQQRMRLRTYAAWLAPHVD